MIGAMDCTTAQTALPLYLDGELSAGELEAFERHLADCAVCRQAIEVERKLKSAIRALPRHAAPATLAQRVRGALPKPAPARIVWPWYGAVPALAAGVLLFLLGGVIGHWGLPSAAGDPAARDVVAAHVRALVSNRVTDVASGEGHTVKPWFAGRVEVAPAVVDLAKEGFPLVGGRVDFVDGRRAATVIYRRRDHVISLFVWPSPRAHGGPATVQGYNLEYWQAADMSYAAISDLNAKELKEFAGLFRARSAAAAAPR